MLIALPCMGMGMLPAAAAAADALPFEECVIRVMRPLCDIDLKNGRLGKCCGEQGFYGNNESGNGDDNNIIYYLLL
jgi:hypothetical protein